MIDFLTLLSLFLSLTLHLFPFCNFCIFALLHSHSVIYFLHCISVLGCIYFLVGLFLFLFLLYTFSFFFGLHTGRFCIMFNFGLVHFWMFVRCLRRWFRVSPHKIITLAAPMVRSPASVARLKTRSASVGVPPQCIQQVLGSTSCDRTSAACHPGTFVRGWTTFIWICSDCLSFTHFSRWFFLVDSWFIIFYWLVHIFCSEFVYIPLSPYTSIYPPIT